MTSARRLQGLVVLVGIISVALLLWEPLLEGRNARATLFEVYFHDPFLAYVYAASILYFVALSRAHALIGLMGHGRAASPRGLRLLRTIKHCAIALIACIAAVEVYLFVVVRGEDDIAGGVAVGLVLILAFSAVTTGAAIMERRLRRAG